MRRLAEDRRGVAVVEFACALPVFMLAMLGFADVVQLGRGHHRVQSTATQIGQIVSQCKSVSKGDETQLVKLAERILGRFAGSGKEWSIQITAEGLDADNRPIRWTVQHVQKPGGETGALTPQTRSNPSQSAYTAQTNEVVYKTQVFALVEAHFFAKNNSALQHLIGSHHEGRAFGFAVHTTRTANVNGLTTKNTANASEDCLRAQTG